LRWRQVDLPTMLGRGLRWRRAAVIALLGLAVHRRQVDLPTMLGRGLRWRRAAVIALLGLAVHRRQVDLPTMLGQWADVDLVAMLWAPRAQSRRQRHSLLPEHLHRPTLKLLGDLIPNRPDVRLRILSRRYLNNELLVGYHTS